MGDVQPGEPNRDFRTAGNGSPTAAYDCAPWTATAILGVMVVGGLTLDSPDDQRVCLRSFPAVRLPEVCLSKTWLHVPCPLCGATRSVIALLHGRWSDAWRLHRCGALAVAVAATTAAVGWWAVWFHNPRPAATRALSQCLWWTFAGIVILNRLVQCFWG